MTPRAILLALMAVLLGVVGVFRFGLGPMDAGLEQPDARRSLRIGYAVEAPYAFVERDGRVTGESPELARIIAARLGQEHIEWRQMHFDELIPELEQGRLDLVAAGLFITPERNARVLFSTPTFHVQPALLVARNNPHHLTGYRDAAARADLKIAVLPGSAEETLLSSLGAEDTRLLRVPDARSGRMAVENGLADALALSAPTVRWMAEMHREGGTDAVIASDAPDIAANYGRGGFAFQKSDHALADVWSRELSSYVGSPDHRRLLARFGFGSDGPHSPGGRAP